MSTKRQPQTDEHREVPALAAGVVTIDQARIAANWRALADLVRPAECAAVVKADAYGLGAARVIPVLAAAACRTFFVATFDEAILARGLAPSARILVLDGVLPRAEKAMRAARNAAEAVEARPLQRLVRQHAATPRNLSGLLA